MGSRPSAKLEVAMLRSVADANAVRDNRVFYCDLRSVGGGVVKSISNHNRYYEPLLYPLLVVSM